MARIEKENAQCSFRRLLRPLRIGDMRHIRLWHLRYINLLALDFRKAQDIVQRLDMRRKNCAVFVDQLFLVHYGKLMVKHMAQTLRAEHIPMDEAETQFAREIGIELDRRGNNVVRQRQ